MTEPRGHTDLLPSTGNLSLTVTVSGLTAAVRAVAPPPRDDRLAALQTRDRVPRISPRREGCHGGRSGIRDHGFAAELLERVADEAGDSAGWPSPRPKTINGTAGDPGDLGESSLRNHVESWKDQLRIDPPALVEERLCDVVSCCETRHQVFDFVGFFSDVSDGQIADGPAPEQSNCLATSVSASEASPVWATISRSTRP